MDRWILRLIAATVAFGFATEDDDVIKKWLWKGFPHGYPFITEFSRKEKGVAKEVIIYRNQEYIKILSSLDQQDQASSGAEVDLKMRDEPFHESGAQDAPLSGYINHKNKCEHLLPLHPNRVKRAFGRSSIFQRRRHQLRRTSNDGQNKLRYFTLSRRPKPETYKNGTSDQTIPVGTKNGRKNKKTPKPHRFQTQSVDTNITHNSDSNRSMSEAKNKELQRATTDGEEQRIPSISRNTTKNSGILNTTTSPKERGTRDEPRRNKHNLTSRSDVREETTENRINNHRGPTGGNRANQERSIQHNGQDGRLATTGRRINTHRGKRRGQGTKSSRVNILGGSEGGKVAMENRRNRKLASKDRAKAQRRNLRKGSKEGSTRRMTNRRGPKDMKRTDKKRFNSKIRNNGFKRRNKSGRVVNRRNKGGRGAKKIRFTSKRRNKDKKGADKRRLNVKRRNQGWRGFKRKNKRGRGTEKTGTTSERKHQGTRGDGQVRDNSGNKFKFGKREKGNSMKIEPRSRKNGKTKRFLIQWGKQGSKDGNRKRINLHRGPEDRKRTKGKSFMKNGLKGWLRKRRKKSKVLGEQYNETRNKRGRGRKGLFYNLKNGLFANKRKKSYIQGGSYDNIMSKKNRFNHRRGPKRGRGPKGKFGIFKNGLFGNKRKTSNFHGRPDYGTGTREHRFNYQQGSKRGRGSKGKFRIFKNGLFGNKRKKSDFQGRPDDGTEKKENRFKYRRESKPWKAFKGKLFSGSFRTKRKKPRDGRMSHTNRMKSQRRPTGPMDTEMKRKRLGGWGMKKFN